MNRTTPFPKLQILDNTNTCVTIFPSGNFEAHFIANGIPLVNWIATQKGFHPRCATIVNGEIKQVGIFSQEEISQINEELFPTNP